VAAKYGNFFRKKSELAGKSLPTFARAEFVTLAASRWCGQMWGTRLDVV
jgi:hypothetical protein